MGLSEHSPSQLKDFYSLEKTVGVQLKQHLPPTTVEPADLNDYREKLMLTLSSARELAAEPISSAQKKYKKNYDRRSRVTSYKLGVWVLIQFPHGESGGSRKLSRPRHGPFVVTAVKVYAPQDGPIRVHQSRVTCCPPEFPAGYYWELAVIAQNARRNGSIGCSLLQTLQMTVEIAPDCN